MNYRNRALLDLARLAPHCMCGCGERNVGQVVSAHSNQSRDGKGMSLKAHDFRIAFLGRRCHAEIDQGSRLSREERIAKWEEAHRRTIGWLFAQGFLDVTELGKKSAAAAKARSRNA